MISMVSPTWTKLLTGLIKTIIQTNSTAYGLYHLSGEGDCTWFDFASEIYRLGKTIRVFLNQIVK